MSGRGEALSRLELSAGTIEYRDTGGEGRVLVLLHGVLMDGAQWREVLPHLTPEYRCICRPSRWVRIASR
jgi:pimeloyl-ACP methyl ester carboxylesterase